MAGKVKPTSERAKQLCAEFPNTANRSLALILCGEFGDAITENQARSLIRYWRGAKGKLNRKATNHERPESPARAAAPSCPDPWEEYAEPWKHEQLRASKVLVLSDLQCPFHNKEAVEVAVKKGQDEGVTAVLLNGDLLDFYDISDFVKNPKQRDFRGEIAIGRELLAYLRDSFPGRPIWWKLGNHEERWERFMYNKAPQLVGTEEFEIPHWMHCARHNIRVVGEKRPIRIGRLSVIHGHDYRDRVTRPLNPARTLYLKARVPAMAGHHHKTSEHTETHLNGKIVTCWSTGCLCGLSPKFMPLNGWNHGAAIVDTSGEDDFTVHNFRIWKGRIL